MNGSKIQEKYIKPLILPVLEDRQWFTVNLQMHSQQSLANLYTKMNHNLRRIAFLKKKNNENKTYITDAKYDWCENWTQKLSVECEGSYHLAISDLVGKA